MELGGTVWDGLQWAWENILVPLGQWVMQNLAPVFLDLLASAVNVLNEILKAAGPAFDWFYQSFLLPIAEWTGGAIIDALKWLVDRLNDFAGWISKNQALVTGFIKFLLIFAAVWITIGTAINLITGIITVATAVISGFAAAIAFIASPIGLVAIAIIALIAVIALLIIHWDWVKEKAISVWTAITQLWIIAGWWFATNVSAPIRNAFGTALDWVRTKWETTFTGIKNFVQDTVNTIIDFINGMIRAVAGGINAVVGGLNSIRVTIPSWVPGFGGSSWGLNVPYVSAPQIPRLATGAVIPPNSPVCRDPRRSAVRQKYRGA